MEDESGQQIVGRYECLSCTYTQGPIISPYYANDRYTHVQTNSYSYPYPYIWVSVRECIHFLCFISFTKRFADCVLSIWGGWNQTNCMFLPSHIIAFWYILFFSYIFIVYLFIYYSRIDSFVEAHALLLWKTKKHSRTNSENNHACCIIHICIVYFSKQANFSITFTCIEPLLFHVRPTFDIHFW